MRSNGIGYGSGSDRVRSYEDRLDFGKYFNPDLGKSLHDRYSADPTPSRLFLDSLSIASRVVCYTISTRIFLTCQKLSGRKLE